MFQPRGRTVPLDSFLPGASRFFRLVARARKSWVQGMWGGRDLQSNPNLGRSIARMVKGLRSSFRGQTCLKPQKGEEQ